ncbi:hypothetical protein IFR05_005372 [Cadophora sp. M221]|nr:hypothetical protein IFR05_005372 [Cadophora sp. M221]
MDSDDSHGFVLVNDNDINDYNEDGILPQPPAVLSKIQKWLEPTDYHFDSSEYQKHLNSYLTGTGEWVQETESYQQWHSSLISDSLWLKATAGAGKSVLAAMLADKLAKTEKVPVLFFFFRQIIATNHDPQSMVRDWISMILKHSPPLQARMKKYMDERRSLETISANELWEHLVNALVTLRKVYCVVDALDEMDIDKQDFFINLVNLGLRNPSSIKLLLTSRPLPRIEAFFRTPSLKVDKDIAIYVDHRLELANVQGELKTSVKRAIGGKAQGSFLYARLMMDELLDHLRQMIPDIKYIERSLSWLPLTLEDMYNEMLIDHSLRSRVPQDLQLTILQWVTHSSRPLRLLELATIVDLWRNESSKDSKAIARAACGPLLEILEDETVSVIHHSFTEFLTDETRNLRSFAPNSHPQFPVIDPTTTHRSMALICVKYLNSGCLNDWIITERNEDNEYYHPRKQTQQSIKMKHSFLDYAMNNFHVHVCKTTLDEALLSQLDAFITNSNPAFSAWVDMVWVSSKDLAKTSPLHVAAWAGMTEYTQHLLRSGCENNNGDGQLKTPLSWASAKGHVEVVASILGYVTDPDVDDSHGMKPLHYAARGNRHQIVKLLVASGVSPMTGKTRDYNRRCGTSPSSVGQSPLLYACQSGAIESVREMVPYLKTEDLNQALCWASTSGKAEIVDFLLTLPDVSTDPPGQLDTPLFLAAKGLHSDVMNSLLESGADPNKISENAGHVQGYTIHDLLERGKTGASPLHAICAYSRQTYSPEGDEKIAKNIKKCFHLLLKYGCNIDAIDQDRKTPLLHSVCKQGYDDLALLLLENGADPMIRDKAGNTALHLLQLHESSGPLIELLMAKGADVNAKRPSDHQTPLHCMIGSLRESMVKYFLPYVSDWNVTDSHGDTPLHILLLNSHPSESRLKVLLDAGVDLNRRNNKGEAPIHVIKEFLPGFGKRTSVLPSLLASGADIETKDYNGRTVLSRMFDPHPYNFEKTVQYLVGQGAKIDCLDYEGNNILHLMCRKSLDVSMINFFVKAGVNPLSTNNAGNNLLHELLSSEASVEVLMAVVAILLKLNIPTTAPNNSGKTPLHLICSRFLPFFDSQGNALDFVLRSPIGAAINVGDNDGIRPIHLAASISDRFVSQLIDHGADIRSVTNDGPNILHIAARTRQSNIVGLVNDILLAANGPSLLDSVDANGCTPLHYACRSGRPETVAILLKAGADVSILDKQNQAPLHACSEFEEEKKLWSTIPTQSPRACGILIADNSRPEPEGRNNQWQHSDQSVWDSVDPGTKTARIREIIRMLIEYGAVVAFCGRISSPIDLAVQKGCAEMVDELLPHMEPIYAKAKEENRQYGELGANRNSRFREKYLLDLCTAPFSKDDVGYASAQVFFCNDLLSLGKYKDIERLPEFGVDFYPNLAHNSDFLTTLVKCGYADLFQKLGDSITTSSWVDGIKGYDERSGRSLDPYLITAVNSRLPNLEIVKIAVERFGADVNIQPTVRTYLGGKSAYVPGPSPLHKLSYGTQWWQTSALKYLLSKGANTEVKDDEGRSVLHSAINSRYSHGGYRRRETIKILLDHGADPNSIDNQGNTCLNSAMYDLDLVTLLIQHGADVALGDKPVLFSAISSLDVAAVSALLKAGADCNAKQKPIDPSKLQRNQGSRSPDPDSSPLHYVASTKFNTPKDRSAAIQIITLLLDNGADPYLQFRENATVLHDVFKSGGLIQPFLDFPTINLEHCDRKGQTVLLAGCQSNWGTHIPSCMPVDPGDRRNQNEIMAEQQALHPGDPPAFLSVFHRGGDLTTVDNDGNSVFHFLAQLDPINRLEFEKAFNVLLDSGLTLIDQGNIKGFTPLHLALASSNWWAVKRFMAVGAAPLLNDPNGNTPLHHLATTFSLSLEDKLQWINTFLDLGVPIDEKNNLGETALFKFFAVSVATSESQEPFSTFLKAGADIFTTNNEGENLLHLMAKKFIHGFRSRMFGNRDPSPNGFKFLMKMGLDPMAEDKSHRTSLDVAAACSNNLVLDLFKRDRVPSPVVTSQESDSWW